VITEPTYGTVGFVVYGVGLWLLGWLFLWWYWEITETLCVKQSQRSRDLPIGWQPKLKFMATIYEGYTYSAFSFFQAIPWDAVAVPDDPFPMPEPRYVMILGVMEFEGLQVRDPWAIWVRVFGAFFGSSLRHIWQVRKYVFFVACATVALSPFFLAVTSRKPGRHTAVVQVQS